MDNRPGLIANSLIEFGQGGDYHTHSMTEAKESAGFAPLETLPAEWYNNYLYKLDAHINQLQALTRQLQQELSNLLTTAPTPIEPSATDLTQVKAAINQMIEDRRPVIATGSEPGLVVSSAQMSSVSVDSNGVMTPNALSDYTSTQTVQERLDSKKDLQTAVASSSWSKETSTTQFYQLNSLSQNENGEISGTWTAPAYSINTRTLTFTNKDGKRNWQLNFAASSVPAGLYAIEFNNNGASCLLRKTASGEVRIVQRSCYYNYYDPSLSHTDYQASDLRIGISSDNLLILSDWRSGTTFSITISMCYLGNGFFNCSSGISVQQTSQNSVVQGGYVKQILYVQHSPATARMIQANSNTSTSHIDGGRYLNLCFINADTGVEYVQTYIDLLTARVKYLGESNLVTADNAGNLKAHTLELT